MGALGLAHKLKPQEPPEPDPREILGCFSWTRTNNAKGTGTAKRKRTFLLYQLGSTDLYLHLNYIITSIPTPLNFESTNVGAAASDELAPGNFGTCPLGGGGS